MKLWTAIVATVALALAGCGGGGGGNANHDPSYDLVVTNTVPARTGAGGTATFTATVTNAGPDPASAVSVTHALTAGYVPVITCAPAGGATCPGTTGATMTVPSVPAGGALTFTIAVPVAADVRGTITSTLAAAATRDTNAANDSATASTVAEDARNGTYLVFATNGYSYSVDADFDASTYAMTGNGLDASGAFTDDGAGTFTISGNAKFRVAQDLLVGSYDFGTGVTAFVAARRFVTDVAELSGDLNNFRLNLPHAGAADSSINTVRFSSGTYQSCNDNVIYSVANCPAASLWTYTMTIDGDLITGFDPAHVDTMRFRVAKSGSTRIFLRASANASNNAQRFMIALPETSGLAGGTFLGASTAGSWGTTTLAASQYNRGAVATGGAAVTDSASLSSLGAVGPQGIQRGSRSSDGAGVFVMQSGPFAVLIGARGGPAAGYLEVAVPASPGYEPSYDLVVTNTVPARTGAGGTATFTATVTNAGQDPADAVTIEHALTAGYVPVITCAPAGGATCPGTTGATMTVPSLPAGGALTFTIAVPVAADARETITSTLSATAMHDTVTTNNSATASTVAEDARNGTYRVFATNGYSYSLDADFDASTYAMTGNGVNASGSFAGNGSSFTISGNAKFVVAPDLIVGGFDFGSGVKAFVAARRFVTDLAELSGDLNTFRLNLPHTGSPDSLLYAVRFASGTYQVCNDSTVYSVANCPAASIWTYTLTIAGEVITGTDSAHSDTMGFRVAKSGSTLIFLRASANAANTAQRFMIALPETSGFASGDYFGSSTAGSWGTTTLTSSQYSFSGLAGGGGPLTDSASLSTLGALAPQGIKLGSRSSDGAIVFVMQSGPLAVLLGARGGPAVGYLELSAR